MTGTFYLSELHKEAMKQLEESVKAADKALYEVQRLVNRVAGIDAARGQLKALNHYVAVGAPSDPQEIAEMFKDNVGQHHRDLALDREHISLTNLFGRAGEMRQACDQFADYVDIDWQPEEQMYGWTVQARMAAMVCEDDYWKQARNEFTAILFDSVSDYYQQIKTEHLKEAEDADKN